jgi:DNA polymerase-3 subunit delta'
VKQLVLHTDTEKTLDTIAHTPPHALLILAPAGAGKTAIAEQLAAQLIGIDIDKLSNYPYFKRLVQPNGKAISIEGVREIIHFMALRTTGNGTVTRIVLIEHAQAMTTQAQNALLKTIEEPPAGTVLILTAHSELGILPTILSRVQKLPLRLPTGAMIATYFQQVGYHPAAIQKALAMSDGLPGLTAALLMSDETHPLVAATVTARALLQRTAFERIVSIDELTADRDLWNNTIFMLARMADISLRKPGASIETTKRWKRILAACHQAQEQMRANAQVKLVALHFMLAI